MQGRLEKEDKLTFIYKYVIIIERRYMYEL